MHPRETNRGAPKKFMPVFYRAFFRDCKGGCKKKTIKGGVSVCLRLLAFVSVCLPLLAFAPLRLLAFVSVCLRLLAFAYVPFVAPPSA